MNVENVKLWHPRLLNVLPNQLISNLHDSVNEICTLLEIIDEEEFIKEWESGNATRSNINYILYHILTTESIDWKLYIYRVDDLFQSRVKGKKLVLGDPKRNAEMDKKWNLIKRLWESRMQLVRTPRITNSVRCDCMKNYFTNRFFVRDVFMLQGMHEQEMIADNDWQNVVNVVKTDPISEETFELDIIEWMV